MYVLQLTCSTYAVWNVGLATQHSYQQETNLHYYSSGLLILYFLSLHARELFKRSANVTHAGEAKVAESGWRYGG